MKGAKKGNGPAAKPITDARFASFETDPRFRLPSKKNTKTKLDKRFAGMLNDDDFIATAKVDRYGRKLKSDSKKKALERLYEAEEDEESFSDEEDEEEDKEAKEDDIEVEDDDVVRSELRAADAKYDPARGGGFSSSESESESESDSDSDDEDGGAGLQTEGDIQKLQDEQAGVEAGEVTNRIAIVNLDWDHVSSTDLMALFSSFIGDSAGGRINKISVYPSEFGKERMQQEEVEGPPKALFKNSKKNDDSDSDDDDDSDSDASEDGDEKIRKQLMQEGDDQDFDSDALRAYQLDRLRYYYAVMECSSPDMAKKIYEATDGTEYQSSSNFIDLRFIPDEVTFDDEPRDECDRVPDSYKPVEFVTTALQSSKVKLTWDTHPEETNRKESIKRAFNGSRAQLEENDLRAYLASDSEGSDDDDDDLVQEYVAEDQVGENSEAEEEEPKLSKKELARKKMREALGLGDEPSAKASSSKNNNAVGGMQITFTPALSESNKSKKQPTGEGEEETTIEKYKRKERERKEKKREKVRAKRGDANADAEEEEENDSDDGGLVQDTTGGDDADLGFNDPFFTTEDPTPASKSSIRKAERLKKREARLAAEEASAAERAKLAKVMGKAGHENGAEHLDHFDMNEILRAEKQAAKKGKKGKGKAKGKQADESALQQDFEMDVDDKRFQAVFDSHEYAIDPSNPKFKASSGMKKLLEEGRNKRRGREAGEDEGDRRVKKRVKGRR
jgi:hypothetical protein